MADEAASTPSASTKRKKVASPLLDKDGQELDAKGNVIGYTSPTPIQDPKKLIIENTSETNVENVQAGNDPGGQRRSTTTSNMAVDEAKSADQREVEGGSKLMAPAVRPSRGARRDPIAVESVPKRGRPRKRAVSMEPAENMGKQDLYTLLLDIKQSNVNLGDDLIKTIDHKMDEVKKELCGDIKEVKNNIANNSVRITALEHEQNQQKCYVTDLERKIVDFEDELSVYGKKIEKNVLEASEHIQTVECALAEDIETVKCSTEAKIHDIEVKQKEGENRIMEISHQVERENVKMKTELEEIRISMGKLKTATDSLESKCQIPLFDQNVTGATGTQNSTENSSDFSSNHRSSNSSIFQDMGSTELDRTLIVNGVRESFMGNLKLVVKDFANNIGCGINVEEIENAYRIGPYNCKSKTPRPVKVIFKDPIKRDQIFLFKARLRFSGVFKGLKIHKVEHRELRVRGAILQQAATAAREMGHHVLARPGSINIDGCEYSIDCIDEIPAIFRKEKTIPVSPRMLTAFEKARKRAERVEIVGLSLQKLSYGLGFFSAACYLSNFYPCDFICRDTPFKSVEQGYQALKALICKRPDIYRQIMETPLPAKAKNIARYIATTQEWENMKLSIMEELLYCKFRQNKQLYYQLLNTRPHDLFECTTCEFWGTGCRFGSVAMDEKSWEGNNHLGRLLMKVRSRFENERENP